jgi:hypothetical protein
MQTLEQFLASTGAAITAQHGLSRRGNRKLSAISSRDLGYSESGTGYVASTYYFIVVNPQGFVVHTNWEDCGYHY